MTLFRRRLASCALALIALQAALAVAAPLSACCALRAAAVGGALRAAARASAAADEECCPAGSHPPGQCPRHAAARTSASNCRMQCDASNAMQFVAAVPGLLPPAMTTAVTFAAAHLAAPTTHHLSLHAAIPDPPPPRSL